MEMPKPTAEDRERFHALVPDDPRVEVKPMFGNLGAFVNGNMFMGLLGADVGLKLDPADRERLVAEGGGPFGPGEKPMGGYVSLPAGWSAAQAEEWVATALATVGALPPKEKKKRKAKT
jgi:TfoX/Sxy family transcriptional regulator of competence genes